MKLLDKLWILINLIKYVFTSDSCFYISNRKKRGVTTNLIFGYKSVIVNSIANEMQFNKDVRNLILEAVNLYQENQEIIENEH